MRALILSADAGKTFSTAAETLGEQLTARGVAFDLLDALSLLPRKGNYLSHWGKTKSYRFLSRLLGRAYSYEESHAAKVFFDLCSVGAEPLHNALAQGNYDAVICTHVYAGMMMTAVEDRYHDTPPFYFVATDFTGAPGLPEVRADGYFIPHRLLFADFIRYGIPADKLFATGLPVRAAFHETAEDPAALRESLGFPKEGRIVLLRAGNLTASGTLSHILSLEKKLPSDCILAVLCGKNESLFEQLQPHLSPRLRCFGFHIPLEDFLSVASLVIGKPRGLPVAEALAKNLPMVLYVELPGCEQRNFDFLCEQNLATGAHHWSRVVEEVQKALSSANPDSSQIDLRSFCPPTAAFAIVKEIFG